MVYWLCALAVIALFFIIVIYHDTHNFVTRHYVIESDKITKNIRFCLLSDLHEQSFGNNKSNDSLIEQIDKENPDAILIAGDMLTAHRNVNKQNMDIAVDLLSDLVKKYPVYLANGNHEYKLLSRTAVFGDYYKRYEDALSSFGLSILRNESIDLEDYNIKITGLELEYAYFKKFRKRPLSMEHITELIGDLDNKKYNLLIAHNPQYFDEYADWGADLTVSGHVHGGIMRLPFVGGVIAPSYEIFPKYDGGLFDIQGKKMILSRGLGTHTLKIRVFNPGELDVIDLKVK
ncbi:MAG: metallophosphoesterase [Butyrivibrio sp.]|nr:metallophosphoesterase [Butyrivibrio sp.]